MGYVDAAYGICLGSLALYATSLVLRRRRLERADALRAPSSVAPGPTRTSTGSSGS